MSMSFTLMLGGKTDPSRRICPQKNQAQVEITLTWDTLGQVSVICQQHRPVGGGSYHSVIFQLCGGSQVSETL